MKFIGNASVFDLVDQKELLTINSISYDLYDGKHKVLSLDYTGKFYFKPTQAQTVASGTEFTVLCLLPAGYQFSDLSEVFRLFQEEQISIIKVNTLSNPLQPIDAFEILIQSESDIEPFKSKAYQFSAQTKTDLIFIEPTVFRQHQLLFVFDMDSTLIEQECIDELAREAGVYEHIASITERAMRGELDFNQSLKERVRLLQNQPNSIIDKVRQIIKFKPGARELCKALNRLGIKMAVVSGGFAPLAEYVKKELGLQYAFANTLEVSGDLLTGNVIEPIVNAERKAELLSVIAQTHSIPSSQVCAVGDGANDLLMLAAAGSGIAYNAKPKVQQAAQYRLNQPSLLNILYFMGFKWDEINQLLK